MALLESIKNGIAQSTRDELNEVNSQITAARDHLQELLARRDRLIGHAENNAMILADVQVAAKYAWKPADSLDQETADRPTSRTQRVERRFSQWMDRQIAKDAAARPAPSPEEAFDSQCQTDA